MSDKRRQQYSHGGGHHKRRQRPHNKHLYLVLDDWDKGFTIHKIDANSFSDDDDYYSDSYSDSDDDDYHHSAAYRYLPEPPALRLEPPISHDPVMTCPSPLWGAKLFIACEAIAEGGVAVLFIFYLQPERGERPPAS